MTLPTTQTTQGQLNRSPATLVELNDGAKLTLSHSVPVALDGRHRLALQGVLYAFVGTIDHPRGMLGGYLGQSHDIDSGRAAISLRRWTVDQQRIHPTGLALVQREEPYSRNYRLYVEARALMALSDRGYWMVNRQIGAPTASRRLSRIDIASGQGLAQEIAAHIAETLLGGRTNPYPHPSGTVREAAIQVVRHSDRALDTQGVMAGLRAAGVTTTGRTWDFTVRRDLNIRARATRGAPRIASTLHSGTRIFWDPRTLTKWQARRGYDAAHPGT